MLNAHEQALIRNSFDAVSDSVGWAAAAGMFYERLFDLDPTLKPLFKGGAKEQTVKLAQTLGVLVNNIDDDARILPAIRRLGFAHRGYGVEDKHYATVGTALLETLAKGLGSSFTNEAKAAWAALYSRVAAEMKASV